MTRWPTARGVVRFVVHNWPLKVAAIVLATLLYVGLVLAQDSDLYIGQVRVVPQNQPADTVILNTLRDVEQIRYIAPTDAGRLTSDDFRATVDLAGVPAAGVSTSVRVVVEALDPRVTIVSVLPTRITVVLDPFALQTVPVQVDRGSVPGGLEIGDTLAEPAVVAVSGPASVVRRVVAARASVSIDPNGLDVDRDVEVDPIDQNGEVLPSLEVEPSRVHVSIPVYANRQSRSLPVNPVLTGTPAAGFRIAAVEVEPQVAFVEGDEEQLGALVRADTSPVAIFGGTSDIVRTVTLALPTGVVASGDADVTVTVRIEAITETRTFSAGLRLDGARADLAYSLSADRVLVTLFGTLTELDRLGATPLVLGLNVASLGPGSHDVVVVPSLPAGVAVAALAPATVTVTVASPPGPPAPSPSPSTTP